MIKLDAELRLAAKDGQFVFFLQPLIHAKKRTLAGAEALVRWMHPEKGILTPVSFLDFLESSGLISEVDRQVFNGVCAFAAEEHQQGRLPDGFRFSVNLSAKLLHHASFVEDVKATLLQYSLPAKYIEFEITEGVALLNLEDVVQKIINLQALGITFALDDFGTGYSSLSYLKQLPVDKVKIDKSFINDLTIDEQDEALVASVVAIARTLNLVTVAEGVQTQDQADWFSQYDNIIFQGYLFDRPLPVAVFAKKYLNAVPKGTADSVVIFRPRDSNS
ncbi:MAG: EAL domain-containing protein (putative c-di-GMP-specific phosphodiesterase class I) [Oceanicoccus sp.]